MGSPWRNAPARRPERCSQRKMAKKRLALRRRRGRSRRSRARRRLGRHWRRSSRRRGRRRLFLQARRRDDRRDGEVALADRRLRAFRQGDRRDVERIADIEAGEIGVERVRDGLDRHQQLDRVAHDVERAAALEARRGLLVDEVDRHLDPDPLAFGEPQEIDMYRQVLHRVELVVARDGAGLLTVDLDLEHGGEEMPGEDQPAGLVEVEGDRRRRGAGAVDDGGYAALATNGPGGPLADPVARHGLKLLHGSHGRGPSIGVLENRKPPTGGRSGSRPLPPRVSSGREAAYSAGDGGTQRTGGKAEITALLYWPLWQRHVIILE